MLYVCVFYETGSPIIKGDFYHVSRFSGQNSTFFLQNGMRYHNDFMHVVPLFLKIKYIYMKSLKKFFRDIVVLERNLVGKLMPKCDHDFGISD